MQGILTGTTEIGDSLKEIIIDITNAMKSDFGKRYSEQFKTDEDLRQYRRRLYSKLRSEKIENIVDGYETLISKQHSWPPTVPELVDSIDQIAKEKTKKQKLIEEAEELARLPPPTHSVNPLKMLATAKTAVEADNHSDWLERKALALKNHESVIAVAKAQGKIRRGQHEAKHYCKFPGCDSLGAISNGTKGGENFYCQDHYVKL